MDSALQTADWDMTPYFSNLGDGKYQDFLAGLHDDVSSLGSDLEAIDTLAASLDDWAAFLLRLEEITTRSEHLDSYYSCMASADSQDEDVKRDSSKHAASKAEIDKLFTVIRAAMGVMDDSVFSQLLGHEKLSGAAHTIGRLRLQAQKSMSADLEAINSDLSVNGISAWGRLYDQVSGRLTFEHKVAGRKPETLPVSMTRSLLEDGNPDVREAALAGSSVAWEGASDTIAACLNAIAGTRLTLYRARGIDDYLEPALFDAGISRKTLDCMMSVVRLRQSLPQAYLRHKATLLGMETLGFSDLMAPLNLGTSDNARIPWDQGVAQIQAAFSSDYPALAELTKMAIDGRWIDHSPRSGKRPGGFCSSSHITGQSRIFMTYNGAQGDVQTLAHELGHAFHSHVMRDLRPWATEYPMTLAETASTFAENVVTNSALKDASTSDDDKRRILDQRLQDSAAFLLNIPMRFDFESAFYKQRAMGELSVRSLKALMVDAQKKNYGDSLDESRLDPWFWASKLHFYITEISFYNFPYTFGYLFSMGLFARFLSEGPAFLKSYESLLRRTGSATAEQVAMESIGVDLEAPEFWHSCIDLIEQDWLLFQKLTK